MPEINNVLSAASIQKLQVQPGDVLVLEVPEGDYVPSAFQEQIRYAVGRDDVKLVILPPGCKLQALHSTPYSIRRRMGEYEIEVTFATHDELLAYMRNEGLCAAPDDSDDADDDWPAQLDNADTAPSESPAEEQKIKFREFF